MWNSDRDVTTHATRNGLMALAALALLPACRLAGEAEVPEASFGPLEPWARPIEESEGAAEHFPLKFRVSGLTQGPSEFEWHYERARRPHSFDVLRHETDGDGR